MFDACVFNLVGLKFVYPYLQDSEYSAAVPSRPQQISSPQHHSNSTAGSRTRTAPGSSSSLTQYSGGYIPPLEFTRSRDVARPLPPHASSANLAEMGKPQRDTSNSSVSSSRSYGGGGSNSNGGGSSANAIYHYHSNQQQPHYHSQRLSHTPVSQQQQSQERYIAPHMHHLPHILHHPHRPPPGPFNSTGGANSGGIGHHNGSSGQHSHQHHHHGHSRTTGAGKQQKNTGGSRTKKRSGNKRDNSQSRATNSVSNR